MRPARRRELVDRVRATWQVSVRRACSVLKAERSSYHYKGKRRPQAVLMKRIKEIAETGFATVIGGFKCCCAAKAGE